MLKVLKFKHITLYDRDFDEILVEDDSIPMDECACELCIFFNVSYSSDCALIHECGVGYRYWLIGACTAYSDGEANPFGRRVDV